MADFDESSATIPPVAEPLPPARPPQWQTWGEILLCSGYPTQLVISSALVLAGYQPLDQDGGLSGGFVFALSLADTVILLSLVIVLIMGRGDSPRRVFFGDTAPVREVIFGVFATPFVVTLVITLMLSIRLLAPALHNVPDNPLEGLLEDQGNIWIFLFVVIVAGGVREELQRAFLLHRFREDLGRPWMGLLITSLSFGLGHTLQGYDAAIITGALGALWGAMYLTRGGALGPMVSHSLFNSGELLRAFLR